MKTPSMLTDSVLTDPVATLAAHILPTPGGRHLLALAAERAPYQRLKNLMEHVAGMDLPGNDGLYVREGAAWAIGWLSGKIDGIGE